MRFSSFFVLFCFLLKDVLRTVMPCCLALYPAIIDWLLISLAKANSEQLIMCRYACNLHCQGIDVRRSDEWAGLCCVSDKAVELQVRSIGSDLINERQWPGVFRTLLFRVWMHIQQLPSTAGYFSVQAAASSGGFKGKLSGCHWVQYVHCQDQKWTKCTHNSKNTNKKKKTGAGQRKRWINKKNEKSRHIIELTVPVWHFSRLARRHRFPLTVPLCHRLFKLKHYLF